MVTPDAACFMCSAPALKDRPGTASLTLSGRAPGTSCEDEAPIGCLYNGCRAEIGGAGDRILLTKPVEGCAVNGQ